MKEKLFVENNFMIFLTIFFLTTFLKNVMKVIDTSLSVIQFLGPSLHLICLLITLPILCICWIQASILHQLEENGCKIRHCKINHKNISLFFTVDLILKILFHWRNQYFLGGKNYVCHNLRNKKSKNTNHNSLFLTWLQSW